MINEDRRNPQQDHNINPAQYENTPPNVITNASQI